MKNKLLIEKKYFVDSSTFMLHIEIQLNVRMLLRTNISLEMKKCDINLIQFYHEHELHET